MEESMIYLGEVDSPFTNRNDFALVKTIVDNDRGNCYSIKDWKQTWDILLDVEKNRLCM